MPLEFPAKIWLSPGKGKKGGLCGEGGVIVGKAGNRARRWGEQALPRCTMGLPALRPVGTLHRLSESAWRS